MRMSLVQDSTQAPTQYPTVMSALAEDIGTTERTLAALSAEHLATLGDALGQLAATSDADTHAELTERIAGVLQPYAASMVTLVAPSWPDAAFEAEDVAQELLMDVLAALPWAPVPTTPAGTRQFIRWLSTTCLAALADRLRTAKALARRAKAAQRAGGGPVLVMESDEAGGPRWVIPSNSDTETALGHLWRQLAPGDAALLRARHDGQTWDAIARRLRCSVATARRRYRRALDTARRHLLADDNGTPAAHDLMLPELADERAAA